MSDDRHEIARLCKNLPRLHTAAERAGLSAQLESVVLAAQDGRADGITQLLRRMGVPEVPVIRGPGGIVYPPSTGVNRPGVEIYGCPEDLCDRGWIRPPGESIPPCSIRGVRLRLRSGS